MNVEWVFVLVGDLFIGLSEKWEMGVDPVNGGLWGIWAVDGFEMTVEMGNYSVARIDDVDGVSGGRFGMSAIVELEVWNLSLILSFGVKNICAEELAPHGTRLCLVFHFFFSFYNFHS